MMPRPTRAHALIKANLAVTALRSRLERSQWEVIMTFGLDAGPDTFRYPDVIVDRVGGNNKTLRPRRPFSLPKCCRPRTWRLISATKSLSIWSFQAFLPTSCCRRMNRKPGCGRVCRRLHSSALDRK